MINISNLQAIKEVNDSFTDYTKYRDADDLKEKIGTVGNGKKKKVNGPSISMDSTDHAKTANNGKMKGSKAYRGEQRRLIEAGKLQEAFDMDVADIKSTFPGKYDESINQAQKS